MLFTILEGPDKGKTAYDRIPFYHEKEEEWMKNKRLLVAKRTGLISRESKDTETINWKLLEGMKVIIAIEDEHLPGQNHQTDEDRRRAEHLQKLP